MPEFPLIDAHVHFYDLARTSHAWLAGSAAINRSFGPADLEAARGATAIDRLVFVEAGADPGQHLAEARWASELAAADPRIGAIVAHAPLESAGAEADLELLGALPLVRGVRRLIQGESDPSFCLEPEFIRNVRRLPRHNFSFDICVKHFALVYALELARLCPDTLFILDHIGKPDIRRRLIEPWRSQLREIALLPNVLCKLSGVATEAAADWSAADLAPYIHHAIECFGFDRLMFGSDWPVATLAVDYPGWVAQVDAAIAGTSAAERRQLFRDTAKRAYRLGD